MLVAEVQMARVQIFGPPQSSYVWATRMLCGEKGIDYELVPQAPGSEENLRRHPFGKVPAMQHGDVALVEASAILRYLDATFDGPSFVPSDSKEAARMEQWISMFNSYMYHDIVRSYVIPSFFKRSTLESIAEALPNIRRDVTLLNQALEGRDWIAGDSISLADILLAPPIQYLSMFPEGQEILGGNEEVTRWLHALRERPTLMAAAPQPRSSR